MILAVLARLFALMNGVKIRRQTLIVPSCTPALRAADALTGACRIQRRQFYWNWSGFRKPNQFHKAGDVAFNSLSER